MGLVSVQLCRRLAMSKKQNTRDNFVLKYLRWRNTDANGILMQAEGLHASPHLGWIPLVDG